MDPAARDYRRCLRCRRFGILHPTHIRQLAHWRSDAELHQLTSPNTAYKFLDDVLNLTQKVDSSVSEVELFGKYVWRSWAGIIRSSGVLP